MKDQDEKQFGKDLINCPFCSCFFFTVNDLDCHMDAYGYDKEEHLYYSARKRHRNNRSKK